MTQSTLDGFVKAPAPAPAPDYAPARAPAREKCTMNAKPALRLQAGGTSTVLGLVEELHKQDAHAHVTLVTLSWRHVDRCGANNVIVANELSGAAYDFRTPPKVKKGEPKEDTPTMSYNELCGITSVGEMIVDLLLDREDTHVVVIDGYPKGQIYARLAVCVAARVLKIRRRSNAVALRATPPTDATCREVLTRFKKCRSEQAMSAAVVAYYEDELADTFP